MKTKNTVSNRNLPASNTNSAYTTELARLRGLLITDMRNLNLLFSMGELHAKHNENTLAIKCFLDIIKAGGPVTLFHNNVYRALARAYNETNQNHLAIKYLQDSIKLLQDNSTYLYDISLPLAGTHKDIARLQLNNNQLEEALLSFSQAEYFLGKTSTDAPSFHEYKNIKIQIYEYRALTHYRLLDTKNALLDHLKLQTEYLSDEAKYSSKIGANYFKIGNLHKEMGNESEALQNFQEALNESNNNVELEPPVLSEIHLFFTLYYLKSHAYVQCMNSAANLLKIGTDSMYGAIGFHAWANCSLALGLLDDAITMSNFALDLTDTTKEIKPLLFAESCLIKAQALYWNNQLDQSLTVCKQALVYFKKAEKESGIDGPTLKLETALAHKLKGDLLLRGENPQKTDYSQALKCYNIALSEKIFQTADVYFKKGFCLINLDEFNKAIGPYETALRQYSKDNKASKDLNCALIHLQLAHNYSKNSDPRAELHINNALLILEQWDGITESVEFDGIHLNLDKHYEMAWCHLSLAAIYAKTGKFVEAEPYYQLGLEVMEFQTPHHYREYAVCLTNVNKPNAAISSYERSMESPLLQTDQELPHTYYAMGKLHYEKNDLAKAEKYFLLALPYFKQSKNIPQDALLLLAPGPEVLIHVCLGDIYLKQNNLDLAQQHYMLVLNEPVCQTSDTYYNLGVIFSRSSNFGEAHRYFDLALEYLKTNPLQTVTIEQIQMAKKDARPQYVKLPDIIKKIFNELTSLYPHVYLGGSTIHTLLNNNPLNKIQDLDFLALGTPTNELEETLKFRTCSFKDGKLYQKREQGFSIDCYVALQKDVDPTKNLTSSDFTISGLYCDQDGKLYDQSERGLDDFFAKRLNTINLDPSETFKNSVCLLRGIKLMGRGFKPENAINNAIKEYTPVNDETKNQELHSITQKLLKVPGLNLVERLSQYGLLEKLYRISNLVQEDSGMQLDNLTKLPTNQSPYQVGRSRHSFLSRDNSPIPSSISLQDLTYQY